MGATILFPSPQNTKQIVVPTLIADAATLITIPISDNSYDKILIKGAVRSKIAATTGGLIFRFNGDNASVNYAYVSQYFNSANALANTTANFGASSAIVFQRLTGNTVTANWLSYFEFTVHRYSNAVNKKYCEGFMRSNVNAGGFTNDFSWVWGAWDKAQAITSVTIETDSQFDADDGSYYEAYLLDKK